MFARRALGARMASVGGVVVAMAVLVAIFASLVAPYDPLKQDLSTALAPRGAGHVLGTDNNGRDVLARVIWGTRVSLIAGLVSVAIAVVAGCAIGLAAGYWRGTIDGVLMRMIDAVLSFPALVLALALGAALFVTVLSLNFVGDAVRDALDPRVRALGTGV